MIRNLFYTVLIMGVLGLLLFFGIYAPDPGKKVVRSLVEFFNWKPKEERGPLEDASENIKNFSESFQKIQTLLQMTSERQEQSAKEYETLHVSATENSNAILSLADVQGVEPLLTKFKELHEQRRSIVESILKDGQLKADLNVQMDELIRAMSRQMNEQVTARSKVTMDQKTKAQQFENLQADLKAFNERETRLDAARDISFKKSSELADTIKSVEQGLGVQFSSAIAKTDLLELQSDIQVYQKSENEQLQAVREMLQSERSVADNHQQVASGIAGISQSISYDPGAQMMRVRENAQRNRSDFAAGAKERAQDQKRVLDARIADQMQRIRDAELNRKLNKR